jgi:carbonic anhydrase
VNQNSDQVREEPFALASHVGNDHELTTPTGSSFAILTCMDARVDPAKLFGLREGQAHVIRNAGARASDDAIRSLVMSHHVLGTREWFVVHHSHCGMALFSDAVSRELLQGDASTQHEKRSLPSNASGSHVSTVIDWRTIQDSQHSLLTDIERIRNHPLVPDDVAIYGYIYQVETGHLVEVPQVGKLGQA